MQSRTPSWIFVCAAALALGAGVLGQGCRKPAPAVESAAVGGPENRPGPKLYYCPMHPSYRADKPGNCPICNMELIPLGPEPEPGSADAVLGHASVWIPAEKQRLIGVRIETAERVPFTRRIRAPARVEVDERRVSAVTLKLGGWVEELFVQSVGQAVSAGDPLLTIYSPELYEAQRSYLAARASLPASDPLLAAARQRLKLWDLGDEDVARLEAGGEITPRTTLRARVTGVVTRRDVMKGAFVEPGRTLLELADLSSVWVRADVYESELAAVHTGQTAEVELVGVPGDPIRAEVGYVYPWVEAATRTARVRVEVENREGRIKPGMYGTLSIDVDLGEQIAVDADAVLETGTRSLVFVATGNGRFEPREVELGARSEGRVVVEKGLEAGERVVSSGTFLVDSESRLKAALGGMAGMPGMKDMKEEPSGGPHRH